jgi:predicted alpha/beta hydrolase family esterase
MKDSLKARGYEVWVPELPENHTPSRDVYDAYLRASDWNFADNLVIGHSSGATTALNLLSSDWFPRVRAAVLVGTFLNESLLEGASWYSPGQFDHLFPQEGFDFSLIRQRAEAFYFFHGSDDPYCSLDDASRAAVALGAAMTVIPGGKHLSSNVTAIPELLSVLDASGL